MSPDPHPTELAAQSTPMKSSVTEARILDAAERVFAKRGRDGTRVREIADAADVTGATLYKYFPSKNALYEAVLERGVQPVTALMAQFAAGDRGIEAGEQLLQVIMQHLAEHPALPRLIYLEAMAEGDYLPELATRTLRPLLAQILGELEAAPPTPHWDPALLPFMAALFVHLSFGHFVLAPLMKEIFGQDPLSEAGIQDQTRLVQTVVRAMFSHLNDGAEDT